MTLYLGRRLMLKFHVLRPPFDAVSDRSDVVDLRRDGVLHGMVLGLAVSDVSEWSALKSQLPALRQCLPEVPFALLVTGIGAMAAPRIGAEAMLAGIRTITGDQIDPDDVREQMRHPSLLPHHQLMWLQHMYVVPKGVCSEVTLRLLEEAPRHATFHGAAKQIRRNPDRLEDLFRDVGATISPGRLCSLVRWTRAGLELQGSRDSIRAFAKTNGYRNIYSLSAGCRRTFGAPPSELRTWIGFEPLFAAYHIAHGRLGIRNRLISSR